jgi:UDP-galactopyranose mutase
MSAPLIDCDAAAILADDFDLKSRDDNSDTLLICFSHLRWNFVFQRPQHLMARLAQNYDVVYWEEPQATDAEHPYLDVRIAQSGVRVATPYLPADLDERDQEAALRRLLNNMLTGDNRLLVRWYYTPMMLPFSRHLNAAYTVYDCMDELAAFKFAPPALPWLEKELFEQADVVFTGGYSLYEAKQEQHDNVHPVPSSVDKQHFAKARNLDCVERGNPRIGFYGVIDERFDIDLVAEVAALRPDIDFEIVGPVVKIDPATLPQAANIIYAGQQSYDQLPECLARWRATMMPFALNESTRYISPTKTPEYLSAGRPVISTPIRDVVRHYGDTPGVLIAESAEDFAAACDRALHLAEDKSEWLEKVDLQLASLSWEKNVWKMDYHIREGLVRAASLAGLRKRGLKKYDYLIVGAGFAGSVMAERLAADGDKKVLVIDQRPHIAGNAFDERDSSGLLVHRYGPHIFHTNSSDIFEYLSEFTDWRPYEHRVLADIDGQQVPIPINRTTINLLYDLNLKTDAEAAEFLASRAEPVDVIKTSEDVVVAAIGRELYENFFRGYTRKQWGLDPSELNKSVTARIPTRTNTDDRYFTDKFQAMPADGYTAMFANMLNHPNIEVVLGVYYHEVADKIAFDQLIWTGPIDQYFGYCFGPLPYRSLKFEHRTLQQPNFQAVGTVNYPGEDVPYTRITEFKHLTGDTSAETSIVYEYPSAEGDPYYPVPREENQQLYAKYQRLADASDTIFVGRLATYKYYNMDQIVGQALATYRRLTAAKPQMGSFKSSANGAERSGQMLDQRAAI